MQTQSLSEKANSLYEGYFHPLGNINFSQRYKGEKAKVVLIVASYFTVIIPAMVIAVYAAMHLLSYLIGRFKKAPPSDLNNFPPQKVLLNNTRKNQGIKPTIPTKTFHQRVVSQRKPTFLGNAKTVVSNTTNYLSKTITNNYPSDETIRSVTTFWHKWFQWE